MECLGEFSPGHGRAHGGLKPVMTGQDTRFECNVCGWIYDASVSDPERGIEPGTRWERLPKDWICPVCRAGKSAFHPIEAVDTMVQTFAVPLPIVIVGSGLAGYSLARELRKRSAKAPIIIVSADGGEVYSKPMLSAALAKGAQADDMVQKQADAVAAELGISIKTRTRVIAIDRADHTIKLSDGSCLSYDRLVLALGADPRVFPAPGSESVGIATVNDLDDYRVWRRRIGQGGRILLIGAGLIGCEFAND